MTRKIPLRQCAVCGTLRPKRELVRVVRSPQGEVTVDRTGRANGRGAYVCQTPACLRQGARGKELARRLEVPIPEAVREALLALSESIA